jgi:predicted amidohydrolase YtcJ
MHDVILVNGNVLTMDTVRHATAVAFHSGRIERVGDAGNLLREARPHTQVIDLGGRTAVPGFTDAHAHIWKIGHLLTTMLDLRQTPNLTALADSVRDRSEALPKARWLLGRGFNEVAMPEKRKPTKADLDRAAPDRPVALTRTCGHIYAVNSVALKLAGIDATTPSPPGGVIEHDANGEPNGLLHETAMGLINRAMLPIAASDYEQIIEAALRHQLALGITASADCGIIPELLDVYLDMDRRNALPARVLAMPLRRVDGRRDPVPLPEQHISDMLRVDTVKFLADGGLSGATAALSIPYQHVDTKGTLRFEKEDLRQLAQESHDQGWRIATHAIGDVAIDMVLSVYESLGPHPKGFTHRIEHFGLPDAEQLRRAARIGVISVPQTIFLYELGANFLEFLPPSFLPRTYPIRSMLDAGLTVALSSDAPVVEDDSPLMGIYAAVARMTKDGRVIQPEQCITIEEALYSYTMAGAIACGDSASRGSITPGKWADVAVLSADPLKTDPEALPSIKVEMTFLGGQMLHSTEFVKG